jgi:CubicO group peptidase (beta-lactamase class C family)
MSMTRNARFVLAAVAAVMSVVAPAVRADAIDDYMVREQAARKIPGLALAIVRHGQVVRVSTYGVANLETGTPVTANSVFPIASLDKGITASGVLKAQELGKLKLEDPISAHVEVAFPAQITLATLLGHTSGLPDMDQVLAEQYGAHVFQSYTTAELLAAVRDTRVIAAPGAGYYYSDAGPFLAQLATMQATGRPWFEWMQEVLFKPAGMLNVVELDPHAIVPDRVGSYTFDEHQQLIRDDRTEVDYDTFYNDIGMPVGDFARWVIMLDGHGPLSEASVRRMWSQTVLADGSPAREVYSFSGYGLGTGLDDVLGEPVVLHTGHSGVAYVKFPRLDLGIVVFTNLEHPKGSDPAGMAIAVAGMIEPRLSLASLAAPKSEPPAAKGLRHDYELFLAGTPQLQRYTAHMQPTIWQNRDTFQGRSPRLGPMVSWQFLRAAPVDGEPSYLFRATHAHGDVYVRFSLDQGGHISRLVWWHL